jgi:SAM-dependent methyltransferase
VRSVTSDVWTRYYDAVGGEPRETLLIALDRYERCSGGQVEEPFAVDLGCGSGRDTAELLRRGWKVLAIDSEPAGIDRLAQNVSGIEEGARRLETQVARFEDASWPAADLVNSSYALPFCPPESFMAVWQRIVASLTPGGRFCGQLFGDRDEWATPRGVSSRGWGSPTGMSFHSKEAVLSLLGDLDVEHLDEVDVDGTTAVGDPKHWHLFHIVARKR